LSTSLTLEHERFREGRSELELRSRVSAFLYPLAVSNSNDFRLTQGDGGADTRTSRGVLLLSGRLPGERLLRGDISYEIQPEVRLEGVRVELEQRLDRDLLVRAILSRLFGEDQETGLTLGLNWRFARAIVGLSAGYSDRRGFELGAGMSFSVGRDPYSGVWFTRAETLANSGAAGARVFLDQDLDGVFGAHDRPLPGVRFEGAGEDLSTDDEGVVLLPGYSPYQGTPLSVDAESLEDPFWVPGQTGLNVITRPGRATRVDFPVLPTGEVDGTVYLRQGDEQSPVSNVRLELVNEAGKVIKKTRSSFDGFYLFEGVLAGRYRLKVNARQLSRLRLAEPAPRRVRIEAAGEVVSGVDLVLKRADPP
jgi:hypothetical protein